MTNLLIALANIVENPVTDLVSFYKGSNRANNMGDALEVYIKDAFCNSFEKTNIEKDEIYSNCFSNLGGVNNPPDIIIREGDAIEVKKIESKSSAIALNSSYPKDKLHFDDPRITEECRNCEDEPWDEKDIVYSIGVSPKESNKLKILWFVYGDCYAANREIYQRISSKISDGIQEIPDIEFIETKELGKVKKVDPLGITDLRIRGMWHIDNPIRVFADFVSIDKEKEFSMNAIILEEKYLSFSDKDRKRLESLKSEYFSISDIKIRSPNNPVNLLKAKLISYAK